MKRGLLLFTLLICFFTGRTQHEVTGLILDASTREPVEGVTLRVSDSLSVLSDAKGRFSVSLQPQDSIMLTATGYVRQAFVAGERTLLQIYLIPDHREMDAIVVTGTMKPVKRLDSP